MRVLLCALLFAAACKTDKPAGDKPAAATPVEIEKSGVAPSTVHRERPQLPRADIPEVRDYSDPEVREEMAQRRAEREKRMQEQLDTNKDGVISPEEHQQRVKPMFDRLDANGDGKLTPDEISASDRRMGFDDPAALDTDKNGEISLGELDAAVTQRREKMRERWRGGRSPQVGSAAD